MRKRQMTGGNERRPSRARRFWGWVGKIFGTVILTCFLAFLIFACIFAVYIKNDLSKQVDFSLEGFSLDQTSVIYYQDREDGQWKELKKLYGEENRVWIDLDKIPKNLQNACIAIEDKRFIEHQGVDWLRTIKASMNLFMGKKDAYGASTITQQLIKNQTHEDEVTVRRKLVEIFRAVDFEKKHSKEEILELYLNIIPLGQGCYGVQSASKVYFGKDVEDLSLAECASLIGITNNPSRYDPYLNPENNKKRQETILYEMLSQEMISRAEYDAAKAEELVLVNASGEDNDKASYFTYFEDQVINEVVSDLVEKTGYDRAMAFKMLQTGGYKIYCTMDPRAQAAVDAVYENLDNIPKTASSQQLESATVIIDNATGDIVAMAGGVGEKKGSLTLNRATQSYLAPGSIIKAVAVFAPALEQGIITPATVYDDTPYQFTDTASWPKNMDNKFEGLESINDAVCSSTNTIAVKLAADAGLENCFNFAKYQMGLDTLVEEYITSNGTSLTDIDLGPLALGGGMVRGVTVRDMAEAYGVFPNKGNYREARVYTRVLDADGKVVLDNTQESHTAMKELTAWYSTYMMENTVAYGTGTGAQIPNMHAAGKTGTTGNDFDRWFAGYTPYYTSVVWCGYNYPEEIVLTDTTENPAVTLWQKTMSQLHQGLGDREFERPTDVIAVDYCRDSGKLATDACRGDLRGDRTVTGYLSLDDVPTENCTTHRMVDICAASDHVANEYCAEIPGNYIYKQSMLDVTRAFPISGIVVQDQRYVVSSRDIPLGFYEASATEVDTISLPCYIHSEEDLPKEEEEEENDENFDLDEWLNGWLNGEEDNRDEEP